MDTEMQPTIPTNGHLGVSNFFYIIKLNSMKFLTFGYS